MTRLEELSKKFRPGYQTEAEKHEELRQLYDNSFMDKYRPTWREDNARWEELTKDWSDEDREWAWHFIAGCSQAIG